MDVDSCIKAYRELAKDIFTPRRRTYLGSTMVHRLLGSSSFSARKLESGIKRIIRENVQCIHTASEGESNTLDQSAALSDTGGPVTFPSGVANKDKYTLEETPMVAQLDQKCKVYVNYVTSIRVLKQSVH